MFGVGFVGGGDMYVALLLYCLLLSISLKVGAAFARSRGWRNWDVPRLRFLWPFSVLALLVLSIILLVGMAWLRPSPILGQSFALVLLVLVVAAVFSFVVKAPGSRYDASLGGLAAAVGLSSAAVMFSVALGALYFMAKYTFLFGLVVLTFYSTRTR